MTAIELAEITPLNDRINLAFVIEKIHALANPQMVGRFVVDKDGALNYEIAHGMKKDSLRALERLKALILTEEE